MKLAAYSAAVCLLYALLTLALPSEWYGPLTALFVPALVVPACWKRFTTPPGQH